MNNKNSEIITFKLEGSAFRDGISLHELNVALLEFQTIIDKSYSDFTGTKRITKKERDRYKIISRRFGAGSFVTDIQIILIGTQITLGFIQHFTPQTIWKLTKNTFEFLKLIYTAKKEGTQFNMTVGDNNSNVTLQINKNTYKFDGPIYNIGCDSLHHYQNLSALLENKGVEKIEASTQDKPDIVLTQQDKHLFKIPARIEEEPKTIKAEIFDFNKYKNIGKLKVLPGQSIPEGHYSFSVIGAQDSLKYIYSMVKNMVEIKVLEVSHDDPLTGKKIIALQVTEII
ncbi:MAG: fructose 1,6-bisphosphatase [Candidatus Hodarchaeales archaeon]|jgi:hypothetical protein